ncbi:MAG: NAD(P)-binding domain-containing protein [Bacteroidota bacterium]
MTIAILGTGSVGAALGVAFDDAGHIIVYGSRDPSRDDVQGLVARTGAAASAATHAEAVAHADAVVLATPWEATEALVRSLDLAGKVVLDATNPITWPNLALVAEPSGGEAVQQAAPEARVVKAFCTIGANIMADTAFDAGMRPALFVAGDDAEAKALALKLAESIGFESLDAGPLSRSAALEHTAVLWISLAMQGGRDFAFGLLRR